MTEAGLFLAGGAVTLLVFLGVFLYAMLSFSKWSRNDSSANR